jgi:hypothetical protein
VDPVTIRAKTEAIIAQELYGFVSFDGSFDFPGMNVNVVNTSANQGTVNELLTMVLGFIQLY